MPQPVGGQRRSNWSVIPALGVSVSQPEPVTPKAECRPSAADLPVPQFATAPGPSGRWVGFVDCWASGPAAGGYQIARCGSLSVGGPCVRLVLRSLRPRGIERVRQEGPVADQVGPQLDCGAPCRCRHPRDFGRRSSARKRSGLDLAHLQNGILHYARQSERCGRKADFASADGQQFRDVTTFLGKLPTPGGSRRS